ncbi:MAG TPA: FG-GAP-like repeat-containing protein [Bacteroidia bacterium]|nr:FG-GAP-like repeat-containing protein [Bacteroidia bacterium]
MTCLRNHVFLTIFFFSLIGTAKSQTAMGFVRTDTVPVYAGVQPLSMAWAGGLNFLQYSQIDLNQDGIKDLFVFDRSGNKITTYLNTGTPNQVSYVLAPQYVYKFPVMHDWALLRDYNCDGKEDIYTCTVAGFGIYENTSTLAAGIQFQLRKNLVYTNRSPNSTNFMGNLYVSQIDLPAIRDIDGDNDLDLLTFSNGGPQVEYHRNMSMELYGVCDSIRYEVVTNCWGRFSESASNASLVLNSGCLPTPLQPKEGNGTERELRHTGSCLECINADGDTDQDLLVGDVGSSYVAYLHNSGTPDSGVVDMYDSQYPVNSVPLDASVFVCPAHLDVNNDGKRDLLFSTAAPGSSENKFSSFYYLNTGADNAVIATYVQDDFLQENMIDVGEGAYPVLYDYDLDGDRDLLIGNHGYYSSSGPYQSMIALYRNDGTPLNPMFNFITNDFGGIYAASLGLLNLAPTFGDLDGDGDRDMLIGDYAGQLHFFRKDVGGPMNFVLVGANYQGIDVGDFAAPQLVDVNRDNKLDLLVGQQNGRVSYYENTGTSAAPVFTFVTAALGGIDVRQPGWYSGFSTPQLFNDNGVYSLVVGSERGWLYRYDNIDGNLSGNFTLSDSMYVSWREGGQSAPAIADMNGDGLYDIIIGNYAGGVSFFMGDNNVSTANSTMNDENLVSVFPNPADNSLTLKTDFAPGDKSTYQLVDLSGKEVGGGKILNQYTTIDCSHLAPGMYICTIHGPNEMVINRKIVISRK